MKEFVVLLKYNTVNYFLPLVFEIKKKTQVKVKLVGTCRFGDISLYYEKLKSMGVEFLEDHEYIPNFNHVLMLELGVISANIVYEYRRQVCSVITYNHASDMYEIIKNVYHLCTDRHQFSAILQKYGVTYNGENKVKLPQMGTEIFLGGYFHYFEVLPVLQQNKKELQKLLERKLGICLNPHLPVISYTTGQYMRENQFVSTLKYLSQYYNVIIKELFFHKAHTIEGENVFICRSEREPLIRFASDVNLVPVASGSLKSCFYFGLKTIPVFSYKMGGHFSRDVQEEIFTKNRYCASFVSFLKLDSYQFEYNKFVPPVSIYDYKKIREYCIKNVIVAYSS